MIVVEWCASNVHQELQYFEKKLADGSDDTSSPVAPAVPMDKSEYMPKGASAPEFLRQLWGVDNILESLSRLRFYTHHSISGLKL